jgi:hypothetical protein
MPRSAASAAMTVRTDVTMFGFRLSATGLQPIAAPSFVQYQQLGEYLRFVEGAIQFWIGDWILYGEQRFGEAAAQAAAYTGLKVDTVKQYAWVAERVPPPVRDPDLSFSHHREVADLPPVEQRRWIKQAAEGDGGAAWPVDRLRREINAAKVPPAEEERTIWVLVGCKGQRDVDALLARMTTEGRPVKVPQARQGTAPLTT